MGLFLAWFGCFDREESWFRLKMRQSLAAQPLKNRVGLWWVSFASPAIQRKGAASGFWAKIVLQVGGGCADGVKYWLAGRSPS